MNIPIIIPCFNRVNSLKRLLISLEQANYGDYKPALIFSVDKSEDNVVIDFISTYKWIHGEKIIYKHEHNIGLKENILFCGDLTIRYDGIILLEDDLYVSPAFYLYAINAAQFYKNEKNISGISLYSYEYEELSLYKFYPFITKYDSYFVQWPSSWGQLWLKHHWEDFKIWYNKCQTDLKVPDRVKLWENSWKKYYLAYMIENDRYFVYPFVSYTNELGEMGMHYNGQININTVNLYMDSFPKIDFQPFDMTMYLYDAFFELKSQIITLNGKKIRVDFDLNGNKTPEFLTSDYVISSKKCSDKYIESFGSIYIPYELNVLLREKGNSFFLYDKQMFLSLNEKNQTFEFMRAKRKIFTVKEMIKYIWIKFKIKMRIGQ